MTTTSFLTWSEHRRTRELCRRLSFTLEELTSKHSGLRRYLELIPRTFSLLKRRRPSVLLVQNPSLILAALTVLLRPFMGYRLVVDAHNEAVVPYINDSAAIVLVTRWVLRKADRVIVTNSQLAELVKHFGGAPIVLPDPLPDVPQVTPRALEGRFSVVVVSTFAPDEPFESIVTAAMACAPEIHFFVTGNAGRLSTQQRDAIPANMTLTGFLTEHDYWSLLASCDAVMDLTSMDNCLVCGAYEAIALGRPLILSNNAASMEIFSDFAEFTDNSPQGIRDALERMRSRAAELTTGLPHHRERFTASWRTRADHLLDFAAISDGLH